MRRIANLVLSIASACSIPAMAYIDKDAPNVTVKVAWHGNEVTGVGTLNGELKGNTFSCPVTVWECFNQEGIRVGMSANSGVDNDCDSDEPIRIFTSNPIRVPEICHMRFTLKPLNGKKPLVGWGPKPLQWD